MCLYVHGVIDAWTKRRKVSFALERFLDFEDKLVLIVHVLDNALTLNEGEVVASGCDEALEAGGISFALVSGKVLLHAAFNVLAEVVVLPTTRSFEEIAIKIEHNGARYRSSHGAERNDAKKFGHVQAGCGLTSASLSSLKRKPEVEGNNRSSAIHSGTTSPLTCQNNSYFKWIGIHIKAPQGPRTGHLKPLLQTLPPPFSSFHWGLSSR